MREMTASEASRNFKRVLDETEHGETIVVTRGGRRIATIAPAPRGNGAELRGVLHRWCGANGIDADFAARVAEARTHADDEQDSDPWHD